MKNVEEQGDKTFFVCAHIEAIVTSVDKNF